MALELNLTKNTNDAIQGTLGKYYARVEYKGTMSKADLAEHMHEHNAIYSQGLVEGILTDLARCIRELILQGYVIKIDNLGLFKASVDGNGLTLEQGSKISAGRGAQRTDEELQANPAAQQFAVGDVTIIMQATGNTTSEKMNSDAKLKFTSKTKALVKSLTGTDADDDNPSGGTEGGGSNSGSENSGGTNTGGGTDTITPGGGGDNNGGSDPDPDPDNGEGDAN